MTNGRKRTGRGLAIGYAIVLLVVFFLAVRSQQTVAVVLASGTVTSVRNQPSAAARIIADQDRRDRQLAAALAPERDPFRDPPVVRVAAPRRAVPVVRPAEPAQPVVQAIIHDQTGPMVRLKLDDQVSGWLREGGTYREWSVEQIATDSVQLVRDGKHYQFKVH